MLGLEAQALAYVRRRSDQSRDDIPSRPEASAGMGHEHTGIHLDFNGILRERSD